MDYQNTGKNPDDNIPDDNTDNQDLNENDNIDNIDKTTGKDKKKEPKK
jgi:hypothetical protein